VRYEGRVAELAAKFGVEASARRLIEALDSMGRA
jgi:hypothetical protein